MSEITACPPAVTTPDEPVRFLLVDDRPENLLALEALLQRDGLELHKARSGAEALELLLQHDFALAMLDVQMPGMDGFELAELMRGTERTRRVPIIFLTAVATDERRHFRGYEAGAVDYLLKPVDPQVLGSKARIFFDLYRHRQEMARQRDELARVADRLGAALGRVQAHRDNSPLALLELDAGLNVVDWSKGAERLFGWKADEVVGQRFLDLPLVDPAEHAAFLARAETMLAGRAARGVHAWRGRRKDGQAVDCEGYGSALTSGAGAPLSITLEILDVTARRRAEETQKLLIGELNHRVKNTLATVQAIALHTLRYTLNPSDFAANFSGRLQSLAEAHSLLSNTTWRGASLGDLIDGQLRLGTPDIGRFSAVGPEVHLAPQAALHLALVLHELGTNARKYGALSTHEGQVALTWRIDDGHLHLVWEESGGPPVKASTRRGFGTTLIEESMKAEGGTAHVSYRAEGVRWEIVTALSEIAFDEPLPVARADTGDAASLRIVEAGAQGVRGRRLLVIEDEPLVSMTMVSALEDAGAAGVDTVATVEQALATIADQPFAAAILDGNLHGRPVAEVAAALTRRGVPFVFVSGYGRDGLPAGFAGVPVVTKPFRQAEIIEALEGLLNTPESLSRIGRR